MTISTAASESGPDRARARAQAVTEPDWNAGPSFKFKFKRAAAATHWDMLEVDSPADVTQSTLELEVQVRVTTHDDWPTLTVTRDSD